MTGPNPIHALLDNVGLPFRSSRVQIMARNEARRDDWPDKDAVFVNTDKPILDGLLRPFAFRSSPRFDPQMPPGHFFGYVHREPDAVDNLQVARHQLRPALGEPVVVDSSNTRGCRWSSATASVTATCFSPELQRHSGRNRLHEWDPRLATACLVRITPGLRAALSPTEKAWVESYRPFASLPPAATTGPFDLAHSPPEEYEAEFVREPEGDQSRYTNSIGLAAGHEALIYCAHQLIVVPFGAVRRFELQRALPAKGRGGSALYGVVATSISSCPEKQLEVASLRGEPDGLTHLTREIHRHTGIPTQPRPDVLDV